MLSASVTTQKNLLTSISFERADNTTDHKTKLSSPAALSATVQLIQCLCLNTTPYSLKTQHGFSAYES